ncbi:MAG: galactose-1-phosphate uridylyltransferase [Pirellulaceae bacterium]
MPQLRKDPLSDRWVIYAEGRQQRPNEFERLQQRRADIRCPFCCGHETDTPTEISTYCAGDMAASPGSVDAGLGTTSRSGNGAPWLVRVIPNKYPALLTRGQADLTEGGLYVSGNGVGAHEVIVESPRHVASLSELTADEAGLMMLAYRDRMRALQQQVGLQYALVFKNVGPESGASLEHSHSQIVATPMVPSEVQREVAACKRLFRLQRHCFYCRVIEDELTHRLRLAAESDRFVAICPYASRMPYETWILPRAHQSHFERQEPTELAELAEFLRCLIAQLELRHAHLAYNYFIHTAPFDTSRLRHYHWHIEILPRLTTTAGFEFGAGYFINPVPPEQAAADLRSHCMD